MNDVRYKHRALTFEELEAVTDAAIREVCGNTRNANTGRLPKNAAFSNSLGRLYVAACETTDYVKVGFTTMQVEKRIDSLQTGNPFTMRLIVTIQTVAMVEKELHRQLSLVEPDSRGEWYKLTDAVIAKLADFGLRLP